MSITQTQIIFSGLICHYSKQTVAWVDESVTFMSKEINSANVAQARPIENFWVCLTQKVRKGGWEANKE